MREALSTALEVIGLLLLAGAGWLVDPALGLAILGLGLLLVGYLLGGADK